MQLQSVFAGKIQEVMHNDRPVTTAIYKKPVEGPVAVNTLGLLVDEQADPRFHGGPNKAVYSYPVEHYSYWTEARPDIEFPPGAFGENLATQGMSEREVCIGDAFRIGTVELVAVGIRVPCFKLGIKLGDPTMVRDFLHAERTGIYYSVRQEGSLQAGDAIEPLGGDGYGLTIYEVAHVYHAGKDKKPLVEKCANAPGLTEDWREMFRQYLSKL